MELSEQTEQGLASSQSSCVQDGDGEGSGVGEGIGVGAEPQATTPARPGESNFFPSRRLGRPTGRRCPLRTPPG